MARTLRKREQFAEADYAFPAEAHPEMPARAAKPARIAAAPRTRTSPAELAENEFEDNRQPQQRAERELQGHVDMAKWPRLKGWVWDPKTPGQRVRLEVAEDGRRVLAVLAGVSRPDLALAGIGDGLYGFDIDLDDSTLAAGRHLLHLRCVETGAELPGGPILLDVPATAPAKTGTAAKGGSTAGPAQGDALAEGDGTPDALRPGAEAALARQTGSAAEAARPDAAPGETQAEVELTLPAKPPKPFSCFLDEVSDNGVSGWIMVSAHPSRRCAVVLRERGRLLSRAVASQFRPDLLSAGIGDGCHAFTLPMPRSLLDGEEHLLEVLEEESGLALNEEPIRWRSAAGAGDKALAGVAAPPQSAPAQPLDRYSPAEARRPSVGGNGAAASADVFATMAKRRAAFPGDRTGAQAAATGTRILIDVSDLVYYIGEHANLTGIQRVQSSIVLAILRDEILPRSQLVFLSFNAKTRDWVLIPTGFLAGLLEDLFLPENERLVAFAAEEARYGILPGALPFDGTGILDHGQPSVLCLLGAAWVHQDYLHRVLALKRRFGTRFVMTVHDLIPIYARETCDQDTARVFEEFMRRMLRHADVVLSVSENTARDVQRYTDSLGIPTPPITVTRNGSSFAEFLPEGLAGAELRHSALPERFVLFVATIEGRKNHQLMLDIWRRMIAEGDDPPHLVCVGRLGWKSSAFISALVETDYLGGRVHLLRDICDADLRLLYDRCLFTVCPTLYEGWGLPIGESLALGKICVCSNRASVPEVAGEFGVYIDIDNFDQSLKTVRALIADPAVRRKLEQKIRRGYAPITWRSVAEKVVEASLAAPKTEWQAPYPYAAVPYSTEISFGHLDRDADGTGEALLARIANMRRGYFLREPLAERNFQYGEETRAAGSWAYPEDWGTWACHAGGELDLALPPNDGQTCFVFLRLRASGQLIDQPVRIYANAETAWHDSLGPHPRNIVLQVRRRAGDKTGWHLRLRAELNLTAELHAKVAAEDSRIPTIGFERLVVVPEDDLKTRLDILYTMLL